MLIPLFLLLGKPADGIQRFHDFIQRTKSFSVQVAARSASLPGSGKGTLTVLRPSSFKLTMVWGNQDYCYVKAPDSALDYQRSEGTYMEYPGGTGLKPTTSAFALIQEDAIPIPLLTGDLKPYVMSPYKLTETKDGVETYTSSWTTRESTGKVVAAIAPDGRLLHFDDYLTTPTGMIHRILDFSNYVLNPSIAKDTFSTVPPLGLTANQLPQVLPQMNVGDKLPLGKWKSARGSVNLDEVARGKLMIVRDLDSPPADALIAYLKSKKLPVKTVVVSLGKSGGSYWSPSASVAAKLSAVGTPLSILLGKDGKITAMWLGYDADRPASMVAAISAALKENSGE